MNKLYIACQLYLFALFVHLCAVNGHGRLMDPVSRGSRWRVNNSAPPDYDDNQGWCGGYGAQWDIHNGKCGLCGNTFSDPVPRQHELGGKYGEGVIVRTYGSGAVVDASVDLTASHKGYFKFDLCNLDSSNESDQCFDQNKLRLTNGGDRLEIPDYGSKWYNTPLQLPHGLRCKHCVIRWTYTSGNRWGTCEDGSQALGCGPQETFRGCSDISIQ